MISLPDFREKQILFVTGKNVKNDKVRFSNDNICLSRNGKDHDQVSLHKIFALFVIGDCSTTTVLMKNSQKYGVSLFFLGNNFRTYARLVASAEGNYLLRMKQYNIENELELSKKIICNKLKNEVYLLKKIKKNKTADYISELIKEIDLVTINTDLLGIEGCAGKHFFQNYFRDIDWKRRSPRTGIDINNLLLDMGYTILFNFIDAMLGVYGFDSYKGFYHRLFFQRKSLVCDIIEPFRSIIDKQILKSSNLGQIAKEDFKFIKGRYIIPYDKQEKYLRIFSEAIMNRKEDIFVYIRDFYYFIMNESRFPEFKI